MTGPLFEQLRIGDLTVETWFRPPTRALAKPSRAA